MSTERTGVPPRIGAQNTSSRPTDPAAPRLEGPIHGDASGGWVGLFHAGDRATMEKCYREQFAVVERAIGPLLRDADRETVIHELFSQLLASPELRRSFQGGSFPAWMATVARHRAIDFARRLRREVGMELAHQTSGEDAHGWHGSTEARLLVERFRRDLVPDEWQGVFELRFLERLTQREAARRLDIRRTTLAYRELRLRRLLRRFLFSEEVTK